MTDEVKCWPVTRSAGEREKQPGCAAAELALPSLGAP